MNPFIIITVGIAIRIEISTSLVR